MKGIKIEKIKIEKNEVYKYVPIFRDIAISVNQDPGKEIYNWIKNVDYFILAKDGDAIIGFMGYTFYDMEIIYVSTAMIRKDYQKKRLGSKIMKQVIKNFIYFRLRNILRYPLNIFSDFYIFFRTQNPSVYKSFLNRSEVFPHPVKSMDIDMKILDKINLYVKTLWPHASLNQNDLVLDDAYKMAPSLAIKPENIPWSGNKVVDNFFKNKLNIHKGSYKAMVVLSRIRLFHFNKIA